MKRRVMVIALVVGAAVCGFPQANRSPAVMLEYVDGTELDIVDQAGRKRSFGRGIGIGDAVPVGSTIATGAATEAELQVEPSGTIIKIAASTSFTVKALAGAIGTSTFALTTGKIRTVAARVGRGSGYEFQTPTSVLGVRGTDFVLMYIPGALAKVAVKRGSVSYSKVDAQGRVMREIVVEENEEADAYDEEFEAEEADEEEMEEWYEDLDFDELDVEGVDELEDDEEDVDDPGSDDEDDSGDWGDGDEE